MAITEVVESTQYMLVKMRGAANTHSTSNHVFYIILQFSCSE